MTIELEVREMTCDGCERIVESALSDVAGVEASEADRSTNTTTVQGDADEEEVLRAIERAGYEASVRTTAQSSS